jgi:hypothetical protein
MKTKQYKADAIVIQNLQLVQTFCANALLIIDILNFTSEIRHQFEGLSGGPKLYPVVVTRVKKNN